MATLYKLAVAILAVDGNEIARGVVDAKVTANGNLYAAWAELQPTSGHELAFAVQATAMPSKYASEGAVTAWAQANSSAILAEVARKSEGALKPTGAKAKVDVRSLIAQTLAAQPSELPKPAAQAALAAEKPTFVMRADVRKLVTSGQVPEKDAEAFQSLCDATTKTASQVLAELGKAAEKSNGRKGVVKE